MSINKERFIGNQMYMGLESAVRSYSSCPDKVGLDNWFKSWSDFAANLFEAKLFTEDKILKSELPEDVLKYLEPIVTIYWDNCIHLGMTLDTIYSSGAYKEMNGFLSSVRAVSSCYYRKLSLLDTLMHVEPLLDTFLNIHDYTSFRLRELKEYKNNYSWYSDNQNICLSVEESIAEMKYILKRMIESQKEHATPIGEKCYIYIETKKLVD